MAYYDILLPDLLKRTESLFKKDIEDSKTTLQTKIRGSSILVLGAAGSIGSAFVKEVIDYLPYRLHLIDINENGLVEVVRDARSSEKQSPIDFKTFVIDILSKEYKDFMESMYYNDSGFYDYILNFAALKHVRSEKDPYTLRRMFYTNTFDACCLSENSDCKKRLKGIFSVSSDKAVNPTSIMGATKQLMEKTYFSKYSDIFSTTRFANVAFSSGSLLDGFRNRVDKEQPIFVPSDTKRYFISHEEAAQLCLLSAFCNSGSVLVPRLPETNLMGFVEIAFLFVTKYLKKEVVVFKEEDFNSMRDYAKQLILMGKQYPIVVNKTITAGEKCMKNSLRKKTKWIIQNMVILVFCN